MHSILITKPSIFLKKCLVIRGGVRTISNNVSTIRLYVKFSIPSRNTPRFVGFQASFDKILFRFDYL